ncbi:MAG TPA: hypothetical protein VL970_01280 [Candidatus Acidoferrales bacterium]|nr:hypothetical protein [Candidatus Acidoferrales bacterium]
MKSWLRNPAVILALVVVWRVLLLVFTVQPIPGNDAFGYDGPVVNFLHGGGYRNPSMALVFPISGTEIYSMYPPLYQGMLLVWMEWFGTSVVSAMALHVALFAVCGWLTLAVIKLFFPAGAGYALPMLLLLNVTFDDRPEGLAFVFGLSALWLVMGQLSEPKFSPGTAAMLCLALLLGLYTSVIVGAYFFGVGFLACAAAFAWRRNLHWFAPFVAAAALFALITFFIVRLEPRWWAGFLESARQQSVVTAGFHRPRGDGLFKLVRTVPVFVLALAALPWVAAQRRRIFSAESPWLALCAGILVMGWVLLALSVTLLPPSYTTFVTYTQILLAAGLLALARKYFPDRARLLRGLVAVCVLLVSIRAAGMTTWGAVCAWKNSYQDTQAVLRQELQPFTASSQPVVISSAFLYTAVAMGVKNPVHSDWYFDHAHWSEGARADALERLRPPRLVLTQFDYYRDFTSPDAPVLEELAQHPDQVEIQIRNLAAVRPPDAIPWLQRLIQHVSWGPVIVDLNWK